jgi:DNA-binding GntR family transcriptional regulator
MREKRRPTLDELKALPVELWRLEAAHIAEEAHQYDLIEIEDEAAQLLCASDITPEGVVELREKLQRATGSTETEDVEPVAQFDAA